MTTTATTARGAADAGPRERSIGFRPELVLPVQVDRKTMTRRMAGLAAINAAPGSWALEAHGDLLGRFSATFSGPRGRLTVFCPYGQRGDRLWVRETHAIVPATAFRGSGVPQTPNPADPTEVAIYRAGWPLSPPGTRWRPSIHMFRWASRLTLEVQAVRVERLQAISEADAVAEGVIHDPDPLIGADFWVQLPTDRSGGQAGYSTAREAFRALWEAISGPESWAADPWIWVVTFRRIQP